jgi:restriction endonuclease S subunit
MRDGWIETTLGEVSESSWGNTEITKSKYVPTGFLAFSASGADGFLDWFEHDTSAVILSAIGAQCGKTWFASGRWTAIKNTIWLKSNGVSLSDKYLFYLSNTEHFWQIRGQAQPFISLGDVKKKKLILPPLAEQKRIVDLISSVDSYIEALQQQVGKSRKSRNAVLHELLTKGGDDWVETTLREICKNSLFSDGDWVESKDQDPEGEFRLIQLADIGSGCFLDKSNRWMNSEQFNRLSCTSLQKNDILIARMPDPIGRACLFPDNLPTCATVVDVAIIRTGNENLQKFLVTLINSTIFNTKIKSLVSGTTRQRISKSNLGAIQFMLPDPPEQKRIVEIISVFDNQIEALDSTIAKTKNLRAALLSDLLSGNHEIPTNYDKLIGAA